MGDSAANQGDYAMVHHKLIWLVVSTPPKNMSSSIGMLTFPTEWKNVKVMFQSPPTSHDQPAIHDDKVESMISPASPFVLMVKPLEIQLPISTTTASP